MIFPNSQFPIPNSFCCIVNRKPSSLGRLSIGTYKVEGTKISGKADTKVNFKAKKLSDEIIGKWTYFVTGANAKFTLKKQTQIPQ